MSDRTFELWMTLLAIVGGGVATLLAVWIGARLALQHQDTARLTVRRAEAVTEGRRVCTTLRTALIEAVHLSARISATPEGRAHQAQLHILRENAFEALSTFNRDHVRFLGSVVERSFADLEECFQMLFIHSTIAAGPPASDIHNAEELHEVETEFIRLGIWYKGLDDALLAVEAGKQVESVNGASTWDLIASGLTVRRDVQPNGDAKP